MEDIVRRHAKLVQLQKLSAAPIPQMPVRAQRLSAEQERRDRNWDAMKKFLTGALLTSGGFYGAHYLSKYLGKKFPKVK